MDGWMDGWMDGVASRLEVNQVTVISVHLGVLQNSGNEWMNEWMDGGMDGERERNVLFNTFYLRLYGVRHMVKDHSDSEKGNLLPPHRILLSINSKVFFYMHPSHRQDNTYHGLCYTSRGALAGTRNSSMGPPHEGSIRRPMSERSTSELRPAPGWMDVWMDGWMNEWMDGWMNRWMDE